MRISVISAAVCCALFPLISVSAAGLSVEQRLAQLERASISLNSRPARPAAARSGQNSKLPPPSSAPRRRAAGAGAQPADHGSRTKTAGH